MDNSAGILKGRPFGGLALMWRKSIQGCSIVEYDDARMLGIHVPTTDGLLLVINVYLPFECHSNCDDFLFYLAMISSAVHDHGSPLLYVTGDFNANTQSDNSVFGRELRNFCNLESIIIADLFFCDPDTFTFHCLGNNAMSWLDHVLTTEECFRYTDNIMILQDFVTSDHLPVSIKTKLVFSNVICSRSTLPYARSVNWQSLNNDELARYQGLVDTHLDNVDINHNLILCDNANCNDDTHKAAIELLYKQITDAVVDASDTISKDQKPAFNSVAGWNQYCSLAHSDARMKYLSWINVGKPHDGSIFNDMKTSKAYFKFCLRQCRTDNNRINSDKLARKLLSRDSKKFWIEIKKLKGDDKHILSTNIEEASGAEEICNLWKDHYETILTSVKDEGNKRDVLNSLHRIETGNITVNVPLIYELIEHLKSGKAKGNDGMQAEHLKYASKRLYFFICLLFNTIFVHSYLPVAMMKTVVVPVIKDKLGNATSKDNYRPIAITTILSKLLECIILHFFKDQMSTSSNQFGFKSKQSTDTCSFVFKNMIDYYLSNSSPVFITFVDASKAFDRLNYWLLLKKLIARNIPTSVIKLLAFWFSEQMYCIKWDNCISSLFCVNNGVRQGGVLSPYLFNLYMDDLSHDLTKSGIGCMYNDVLINHLFYADDSVLLAPSASGLQKLINICESYALLYDIKFNVKKTVCMCIKPKWMKHFNIPSVSLNGASLKYVSNYKYLGNMFANDFNDDTDIACKLKSIYCKGNTLLKNFKYCTDQVKCLLFNSYCSNVYGCCLWTNYRSESLRRIRVAYNNVFRRLLKLARDSSISFHMVSRNVEHFNVLYRKSINSFMKRLSSNHNHLVSTVYKSFYFIHSTMTKTWQKIIF